MSKNKHGIDYLHKHYNFINIFFTLQKLQATRTFAGFSKFTGKLILTSCGLEINGMTDIILVYNVLLNLCMLDFDGTLATFCKSKRQVISQN